MTKIARILSRLASEARERSAREFSTRYAERLSEINEKLSELEGGAPQPLEAQAKCVWCGDSGVDFMADGSTRRCPCR